MSVSFLSFSLVLVVSCCSCQLVPFFAVLSVKYYGSMTGVYAGVFLLSLLVAAALAPFSCTFIQINWQLAMEHWHWYTGGVCSAFSRSSHNQLLMLDDDYMYLFACLLKAQRDRAACRMLRMGRWSNWLEERKKI